jgi:preprotein translocase subunit YajC
MSSYLNQVSVSVHGLILASTSTTTAPKKTGSTSTEFLFLAIIFVGVYFLFLRPRSQRMRRTQQQKQAASIGDEVMLTSGIIGRVTSIDGDRASIEIAPEIEVEVVSRAIGQVLSSGDADVSLDVPPDPGHNEADDVYDGDEHEGDGYDAADGDVHDATAVYGGDEHEDDAHESDAHEGAPRVSGSDVPVHDESSNADDGLGVDGRTP